MNEFRDDRKTVAEAEATLRLVAHQPAPEGLAGRVHQRLEREKRLLAHEPERRGFWRLWLPAHRIQFAGAAALATVLVVSMLSVRHSNEKGPIAQTPSPQTPVPTQGGTFRTGAAQAYPKTLKPIPAPQAQTKKKKPSAGRSVKHPAQARGSQTNVVSTAP